MKCKSCNSENVIKGGTRKNKQKWICKSCGRHFTFGEKDKKKDRPVIFNYSLGYVIGVLIGDGSISKWKDYYHFDDKNHHIKKAEATRTILRFRYGFQLQCKDRDFATTFAKHLKLVINKKPCVYSIEHPPVKEIAGNVLSKPYVFKGFKVHSVSKEWYFKLKPLTENLSWIENSNNQVKCGFLVGLFDSDGGVSKRPRIHLTNKNRKLLSLVKDLLNYFGIKSSINPQGNLFRLWIHSKQNVRTFYEKIGFSINRKKREMS